MSLVKRHPDKYPAGEGDDVQFIRRRGVGGDIVLYEKDEKLLCVCVCFDDFHFQSYLKDFDTFQRGGKI